MYTWYNYFEQRKDTIGKLSETKWNIEEVEEKLIMKQKLI